MSQAPSATLSEAASKDLLRPYGIPFAQERVTPHREGAVEAARAIGYPVVLKLSGDGIAHKTERDLVRVGLADDDAVSAAAKDLLGRARPEDGQVDLLVAAMVGGRRELIAGVVRDPQFGPCVLLGLGGILTEALGDAVFATLPLTHAEAERMVDGLSAHRLFTQPFRGEPAVDRAALADVLVGLGRLAGERPDVRSVDLNPLIVCEGRPVAVDALVELSADSAGVSTDAVREPLADEDVLARFRPLFHPAGIIVAGVSGHPGKFGFVTLHNLMRFGFAGEIFPIKPDGAEVLGRHTHHDVSEVPAGAADLVFVCTPNKVNVELLRACAAKGVRAAFVASAGYGEAGEAGRALQRELVEVADELGVLLIGPNGQGVISTPAKMCAQIVAPYPPPGRIGVASQSGNLVSSYLNYAVSTGVGVSKAVSLGNSAQTGLADILEYFAVDPETDVVVSYVEGVGDGRRFRDAVARLTARKPLVLVKGGASGEGARAAASHTGALASDDRVFDGLCRQLGVLRAPTVEEAFEWAATLATQPLPRGPRTVVFTSVGGWGVLAADACVAAGLELIELPDDIRTKIDSMVPARWSRSNPIDLAGGETRDTIPELLDLVTAHPDVDAVLHLGLGIQAAQAGVFSSGPFFPDHGLERISSYHDKQEVRFARAAREASERHGKPVLSVTELAVSNPQNPGPAAVRDGGRVCYPSAHRAVRALRALLDRSRSVGH
ncbi:MAG: acetate--CoA ligase family protein [Deltaproteobacteria bacterium]|nr:acetate--CoA ligase family protein [Deltaproteobacteria bacterium]MBW2382574.1 acetate--CoA ligase family protein [Deltaproteobacteria bacterium]